VEAKANVAPPQAADFKELNSTGLMRRSIAGPRQDGNHEVEASVSEKAGTRLGSLARESKSIVLPCRAAGKRYVRAASFELTIALKKRIFGASATSA